MNDPKEFRKFAHQFVDWMADYLENIESYPVKSQVKPGEIFSKIPDFAPEKGESMESIFQDFQRIILPGITHWQSPGFHAYFPGNSSYPSLLAEMLTATLGAQCMKWVTSPAATELEEKVMNWLKELIGIPAGWDGVIQDTASTATLTAILCAREKYSNFSINEKGFVGENKYRIYCSTETHSSIEKAVRIAGYGKNSLVKIKTDSNYALDPLALEATIRNDINIGLEPVCVVATLGTTGSTAIDPLDKIASICEKNNIWLHVDAAYAGTALFLPEYKWMINGINKADSFVFNPHKWLFTNFDCSAYFVKDKELLIRTFEILPEYLKTSTGKKVNDYCDWGIQLGRRFRALKLWFVLRNFGVEGIQNKLRFHISLSKEFRNFIDNDKEFELITEPSVNVVCFHFIPPEISDIEKINLINETLLEEINKSGEVFLSHTKLNGVYTIRMVIGQTNVERKHIVNAWELIKKSSLLLKF
ncbi:pyridoxal phosphate-dependent decarboxylase family protein [Bacteroidota bacterium]